MDASTSVSTSIWSTLGRSDSCGDCGREDDCRVIEAGVTGGDEGDDVADAFGEVICC